MQTIPCFCLCCHIQIRNMIRLWCNRMKLNLNVSKTKEMIINFSKKSLAPQRMVISDTPVHVMGEYNYLGMIIDNRLKFDQNTDAIIKKSHQRLYVLRKLNSFNVQSHSQDVLKFIC